ncbi:MAG: RtcB family protein [Spirochaetota bacterium]|nr:RtcB family protein [Spirochaetota bacterium]
MNKSGHKIFLEKWIAEPLDHSVNEALERLCKTDDVRYLAVMPDIHLSHDVCIGTVMATDRYIYPQAVGRDIGCGLSAARISNASHIFSDELKVSKMQKLLKKIVPSLKQKSPLKALPESLIERRLSCEKLEKLKGRDGLWQFGTLGRGNHFLEFQMDEVSSDIWVTAHSGSRAMGQAIYLSHLRKSEESNTKLRFLGLNSEEGNNYLNDAGWAVDYARLNRQFVILSAIELMKNLFGMDIYEESFLDCAHNYVTRETHFGRDYLVHRKGAIGISKGELAIIPGSMGTYSYHVEGLGCEKSLNSASHGAGRAMSRSEARNAVKIKDFKKSMTGIYFDQEKIASLRSEAPMAYKDITSVMRAQRDLVKIIRRLKPIMNHK